jgi:cell division protease FtsH
MARKMVTEWGLSDKIGMIDYGAGDQNFLGQSTGGSHVSDDMAAVIDDEVKRLVQGGYDQATKLLKKHAKDLETLAQGLLEYETLSGTEIKELLKTGKVDRSAEMNADKGAASAPRSSVPSTVSKPTEDKVEEKEKPKPKKKPAAKKKTDEKKENKE